MVEGSRTHRGLAPVCQPPSGPIDAVEVADTLAPIVKPDGLLDALASFALVVKVVSPTLVKYALEHTRREQLTAKLSGYSVYRHIPE